MGFAHRCIFSDAPAASTKKIESSQHRRNAYNYAYIRTNSKPSSTSSSSKSTGSENVKIKIKAKGHSDRGLKRGWFTVGI
jgi:hypothetical protein